MGEECRTPSGLGQHGPRHALPMGSEVVADLAEAMVAVPARVLVEVALVVVLGVVEDAVAGVLGGRDLGGDGLVSGASERRLVAVAGILGGGELGGGGGEDRRAVLRADVVALTIGGRRIVVLPERLHQLVEVD